MGIEAGNLWLVAVVVAAMGELLLLLSLESVGAKGLAGSLPVVLLLGELVPVEGVDRLDELE
jgi:hypothetical protein